MKSRPLPSPAQPTTLLPHLLAVMKDSNRTRVKNLLRDGLVHVNGASVTRHDHPLQPGDAVEVRSERAAPAARRLPFPVLYEDASLLAIDKPNGLLTIATATERQRTVHSLVNQALASTRERVFVVHRLDKYTSGVLLLAKSEAVKNHVMEHWKETEKIYLALVEGTPNPTEATLEHYLREDERLVVHASPQPSKNAQHAVLHYRVLRSRRGQSLLRVHLETGRKNQIRAQLTAIGHPIAGDEKYGATTDPLGRLALHAWTLSLPHPVTGETVRFEASPPPGMEMADGAMA